MYNPNYIEWSLHGWTCPKCGRSFAPHVNECFYCNNKEVVYRTGTSINDSEWWQEYLKKSQTGNPIKNNPSTTTASITSNPNIKVTSWNNITACTQKCEECNKFEKSCFGGIETTENKTIISHRKPLETHLD